MYNKDSINNSNLLPIVSSVTFTPTHTPSQLLSTEQYDVISPNHHPATTVFYSLC